MEVAILNVPTIFPQMDGDSIRAAQFRQDRGPDGIGFIRLARLPQRRDMVDVDTKFRHGNEIGYLIGSGFNTCFVRSIANPARSGDGPSKRHAQEEAG